MRSKCWQLARSLPIAILAAVTPACSNPHGNPVAPSAEKTWTLSGTVTDSATGSSIVGATVTIVSGKDAGAYTRSAVGGQYTLSGLHQSTFTISVSSVNYNSRSQVVTLTSDVTLNVSLQVIYPHISLTGVVTDAVTAAPIQGAVVYINGRNQGTTDQAGAYSIDGLLDYGSDFTITVADDYVVDYRYIHGGVQNVRLRRITRIAAGDSAIVTVQPDDTLCVNNMQDTPDLHGPPDYICGNVRVRVPENGTLTIEAFPSAGGVRPGLEVEIVNPNGSCCSERLGNPTSIVVVAGDEVTVNVEMLATIATSQSFRVMTTFRRQ